MDALDRRRAEIARRYIRRLALEPELGVPVDRGLLGEHGCRRIYFDRNDQPDDLFGGRQPPVRCGDEDLSEGPGLADRLLDTERCGQVRLVVVLAIGRGHAKPPRAPTRQRYGGSSFWS